MAIVETAFVYLTSFTLHLPFCLYKKGRENVLINNLIDAASETVSKR